MLYFSASRNDKLHCTGVATSDSIEGPYTARADPWACPLDQGGAIDASGFLDSDGSRYVTYKIDVSARAQISLQPRPSSAATINIHADPVSCNKGNAIGGGGICGNTEDPIQPTPILQQKVAGNGIDKIGNAYQVLGRSAADGPVVEAPSIAKLPDGRYVLFFSSNCFYTPEYDVTYAIANSKFPPTHFFFLVLDIRYYPVDSDRPVRSDRIGGLMIKDYQRVHSLTTCRRLRPIHQVRPALRLAGKARLLVARWSQHRWRRKAPCLPLLQPGRFQHPLHVHCNPHLGRQLRERGGIDLKRR